MPSETGGPGAMKFPGGEERRGSARDVRAPADLSPGDSERVGRLLAEFVKAISARFALVVDRDGRRIAHAGAGTDREIETARALATGWFEVARVMRELLGREGVLVHLMGGDLNVELTPVDEHRLMATVFSLPEVKAALRRDEGSIGARIAALLDGAGGPEPAPPELQ